jgi:hypothetical protein
VHTVMVTRESDNAKGSHVMEARPATWEVEKFAGATSRGHVSGSSYMPQEPQPASAGE